MRGNYMRYIGYFLLLFFYVSANVVHGMEEEQPQFTPHALNDYFAPSHSNKIKKLTKKLPLQKKTDNPSYCKFTLECPSCKKKIHSTVRSDLNYRIDKHFESTCRLTERKRAQALEKIVEPEKIYKIKIPCPFQTCPATLTSYRRKNKLRPRLLSHFNKKHKNDQKPYQIRKLTQKAESFKEYFNEFGTTDSIPNPNKKRKLQHSGQALLSGKRKKIPSKPGKLTN